MTLLEPIRLSVRQLVGFLCSTGSLDSRFTGFDRAQEGARIHRRLQKAAGEGYQAEVFLKETIPVEELAFTLEGRADGIFADETGLVTIDEIKTVATPPELITPELEPAHWAQGQLYAALYARREKLSRIAVRLTYYQIDTEEIFRFSREFSSQEAEAFLQQLLKEYLPWARRSLEWAKRRQASLQQLTFPFPAYRSGQYAMAGAVYRTLRDGERLLCQAPTGIGKTMSCLFPALKALGEGCGDRVFYLTARTTQCAAAGQALSLLRRGAPGLSLRSITLTAKDKICFLEKRECTPEACPYARGYYDRLKEGLWAALDESDFSRPALEALARRFTLCPFELGLDLSLWCDVIIGDYNYLFDPVVSLKRFFESGSDALFLVDEAHNLPDRARSMHSAQLTLKELKEAKKVLGRKKSKPRAALARLQALLEDSLAPCAEAPRRTLFLEEPPASLLHALQAAFGPLQDWLDEHREGDAHQTVLEFYFSLRAFLRVAEAYDHHYTTQLYTAGRDGVIQLLCLDPSAFIDKSLSLGRGAVLFSATLSPLPYYQDLLGCSSARCLSLPSPFPAANLGLFQAADIRTTYKERANYLDKAAHALAAMVQARTGNYLACFPSYQYLNDVLERFRVLYPEIPALVQEPALGEEERAAFLEQFCPAPTKSLLAFVVMGGIFGEGIDLAGDRLIGAAIVGVGLPQVNPVQEKLREYFDAAYGKGFEYAYQYPGMNKVQQAAGRVIRTENDRGVVLLLDERFGWGQYRSLLPAHWAHLRPLRGTDLLKQELSAFWQAAPLEEK